MRFREWIKYPEAGNWVIVLQDVLAGAKDDKGAITLPKGNYIVMSMTSDLYVLKNTKTHKIYDVFVNDLDDMIKDKVMKASE